MSPQAFLKLPQLVRFLLLGGLAAAINWLVRFPLSMLMPFPAAVFVAYLIGMSAGFTLYRTYVFPNSAQPVAVQAGLFLTVNAVGAVVVMGVSIGLLDHLLPLIGSWLLPEAIAHGTGIAVGAVVNFLGHKYLSFRVASARHPDRAENLT
ncbi:GtrA family protein [Pelagibacterium mangrovi]|uniref:GtrA family protein n=1 Tax=Pelagibacterium mangrovi TaxID=3119828 RepID=UPI002FCC905E